jgi:hypothetical protein
MRTSLVNVAFNGLLSRLAPHRGATLRADCAHLFNCLSPKLEHLSLTNNSRGGAFIAGELSNSASLFALCDLRLSGSTLNNGEEIARIVDLSPSLTRLELNNVRLDRLQVAIDAVGRHKAMRILDVSDSLCLDGALCTIGDNLVAMIRSSLTLEELNCANTTNHHRQLVEAIADAPSLRKVDLSSNTQWWGVPPSVALDNAFIKLLALNTTLNCLRCPEIVSEQALDVWEEQNFSLYYIDGPVQTEGLAGRLQRVTLRNRRIQEWTSMRERVLEVALAFGELQLPPYVLELVLDCTDECVHRARHWSKIHVLIAVQKFHNLKLRTMEVSS